jgi:hypothetical protein
MDTDFKKAEGGKAKSGNGDFIDAFARLRKCLHEFFNRRERSVALIQTKEI